ncbi:hypothetical protein SDC9_123003 [bioreactor metagenome]|uniref:EamA domain-containing protein n=1 Tax=bioreactor metagenome TaxID=1076179 RepID=A0A645CGJ6_9ZZZZ
MLQKLQAVRDVHKTVPSNKKLLYTVLILFAGLCSGTLANFLDIYTTNLGNIFSQMSVWILIGTVVAVYSSTPKRASLNVFLFSAGMIITYYLTSILTDSVYSKIFIYGWSVFTLLTPVFAYFTWYAKGHGWFAKLIASGIVLFMILTAVVLFDKIRASDIILIALTCYILFRKEK